MDTNLEQDSPPDSSAAGETDRSSMAREPAVDVDDLTKVYGSGEDAVTAVDELSFEVEPGTAVGLLGPNGAGKTTTIKSLLGLIVPTSGETRIQGVDAQEQPARVYRHAGAMLEGARNVYWRLTVRENLRFFAALAGQDPDEVADRHDELLEQFDLAEKADVAVRELSRGMQQKVTLASTLARESGVVFLDEPTLGLDVESSLELRKELRNLIEDEGLTVLLSSHDMDVIEEVCDRVIIVNDGQVVADDSVENLLDLFRTRSYEVTVEQRLSESARDRLRDSFDADGFEPLGGRERFAVSITGDEFYELTDALREAGATVDTFDAVEPDLEEVFLRLTDGSGANGGEDA